MSNSTAALQHLIDEAQRLPSTTQRDVMRFAIAGYLIGSMKHLPGQHDQSTHGHGGTGRSATGATFLDDSEARYGSNSPSENFNKQWKDSLTPDELKAIDNYTGGGYRNLNESLRNDRQLSDSDKRMSDSLDSAIDSSPEFDKPAIVYRGVSLGDSIIASHGAEMVVMNEAERSQATRKYIADYAESTFRPGSIVQSKAFQSTSFKIEPALDASLSKKSPGIIFEIAAKKGAFLNGLSRYDDEDELLLSRKTKYKVIKVIRSVKFSTFDNDVERTVIQVEQMR